jgi:hypothetical protein
MSNSAHKTAISQPPPTPVGAIASTSQFIATPPVAIRISRYSQAKISEGEVTDEEEGVSIAILSPTIFSFAHITLPRILQPSHNYLNQPTVIFVSCVC